MIDHPSPAAPRRMAKAQFGDALQRVVATDDEAESHRVKTEITDAIRARYPDLGWASSAGRTAAASTAR